MDCFIEKAFRNRNFDKTKLSDFGFKAQNNQYTYITKILKDQFKLTIKIIPPKNIETKLIDCNSNDEYTLHLIESADGKFVGEIRAEYENILSEIANQCCCKTYFSYPQANRLTEWIIQKYNTIPEFLWEKSPAHGVFRNSQTKKWYGLIANIEYSKITPTQKGKIEILNIKLSKEEIQNLLTQKGFYPAYHMNKKTWITLILDETIPDKKIKELLNKSYIYSQVGKTKQKTP